MSDSFKDPKIIIGILAIINTIVLALVFQWWRNRKSLSCKVVSDIPLFSVRHEIKHRVQVLLDGKPVENIHLVIMKVVNTGRVPVDDKDFVIPINVSFSENSEILTADITEVSPSGLPAKIIPEKQCVTLEPLMLNRGDAITIQILVSKLSNPIRVDGRVKGVPQLQKHGTSDNSGDGIGGCLYVWGMAILSVTAWGTIEIITDKLDLQKRLGFGGSLLIIILQLLSFLVPIFLLQKYAEKELYK